MFRKTRPQFTQDKRLRLVIDLGNQVNFAFVLDVVAAPFAMTLDAQGS